MFVPCDPLDQRNIVELRFLNDHSADVSKGLTVDNVSVKMIEQGGRHAFTSSQ